MLHGPKKFPKLRQFQVSVNLNRVFDPIFFNKVLVTFQSHKRNKLLLK